MSPSQERQRRHPQPAQQAEKTITENKVWRENLKIYNYLREKTEDFFLKIFFDVDHFKSLY